MSDLITLQQKHDLGFDIDTEALSLIEDQAKEIERLEAELNADLTKSMKDFVEQQTEIERLNRRLEKRSSMFATVCAQRDRYRDALEQCPEPIRSNKPGWLDLPMREHFVYWYVNTRAKALNAEQDAK